MKAVLISIQPKWVAKIANGEKTIEVRKTAPKEVPFKCYIYETKGKKIECGFHIEDTGITLREKYVFGMHKARIVKHYCNEGRGKVIGEFMCDNAEWMSMRDCDKACITLKEAVDYGKGKKLYAWHISDLKIYDKPKELSEFSPICSYKNDDGSCQYHKVDCLYQQRDYNTDGSVNLVTCGKSITCVPSNWCYVEEL